MGYRVGVRIKKNGAPSLKIVYEWFENGVRKYRTVPRDEWASLGFAERMTPEEAKARMRALNELDRLDKREKSRTKTLERIETESARYDAFLGPLAAEFERNWLMIDATAKTYSNWKAAKMIMVEVGLSVSDFEEGKGKFYTAFAKHGFSPSYVEKLTRLINQWGRFVAKRTKAFFEPLPLPAGNARQRLLKAAAAKPVKRGNRASAPLTPEMLESKKSQLQPAHYNWLYLSIWLGGRPNEITELRDKTRYRVETIDDVPVIWIYQSKLQSIDEAERWKPIPLLYPEQRRCLAIISSGQFRLPSKKVLAARFGEKVTAYGGRKNFSSLMRQRGHTIEEYHVWMGHKSIQRTFANYVDKLTAVIKKRAS